VTDWQPISTAPQDTRILVCSARGRVQIARTVVLRWYDDAGTMMDEKPVWWMPLPKPRVEEEPQSEMKVGPKPKTPKPVKGGGRK
jgi:hypothetical protein